MIGYKLGHFLDRPLAPLIKKIPLSPNLLTVTGFLITAGAAFALTRDLMLGGILILAGGLFDILDGIVARVNGKASRFGAYLDSVLDRYADAFLFFGVAYGLRDAPIGVFLATGAFLGAFMISYARARAEGLGVECKVGLMERPERILLLAAGAISGYIIEALWVMFALTNLTALQRVIHTRKSLRGD